MSTPTPLDRVPLRHGRARRPVVTIHHNLTHPFSPYQDGDQLLVTTSHVLDTTADVDPLLVADWAYRTFNADLDMLEVERYASEGEAAFLAACVYRLLGHRSLSVGEVIHIRIAEASTWLACDPYTWRPVDEPSPILGQPFGAATVYAQLDSQRPPSARRFRELDPEARDALRSATWADAVSAAERYVRLLADEAAIAARQVLPTAARIMFRAGDDIHGVTAALVAAYDSDGNRLWHEDDGVEWPDESLVTDPLAAALEWPHGSSPVGHEPGHDVYHLDIGPPAASSPPGGPHA